VSTTTEQPAPLAAERHSRSAWRARGTVIALRILVIIVVLALWQAVSGHLIPAYEISAPSAVISSLGQYLGSAAGWADIRETAYEIILGFLIGVGIGTVLGLVLGSFRVAGQVLEPLIAAVNGVPKIALAPLFLLFFGIGAWSKITIAALGVSFVVFYNIYLGLRLRERELVEVVQVMGGKRQHVLGYVTLPTLVAPFFAALKTSGPLAILGVIAGEFIASSQGVGHELFTAADNLDAASEFAGLIVLVVMTLILNGVLSGLDNVVLRRLGLADQHARRTA
jgi:NitT/TauT family transport system permease protein